MLFRIRVTDSGWIIEGGKVVPMGHDGGYNFVVEHTDVACDEDQIGPIMNQFNVEEANLKKEKHREEEVKRIAVKLEKKKTTKKKVVKKKVVKKRTSAAQNDKPNMVIGTTSRSVQL